MTEQNVAAEAHQRILEAVGDRYNKATLVERAAMERNLAITKARAMSSVRGLKSLFPALNKKLSVHESKP